MKQRTQDYFEQDRQPGPFFVREDLHTCFRCGDKAVLNCFKRCASCELQYQKDLLLDTMATVNVRTLDNDSIRLIFTECSIRAAELLARGERE